MKRSLLSKDGQASLVVVTSVQVIDRAVLLRMAIAANCVAVNLKILAADTGLHTSTACRILGSLMDTCFGERGGAGQYLFGRNLLK